MNWNFWKQSTWITTFFLMALYVLAVVLHKDINFWNVEIIRIGALGVGFLLPHLLGYMFWNNKPKIEHLMITMLILLLLSDPRTSWMRMVILGLLTSLIKTAVRLHNQPIFNPAAAGLYAAHFFGSLTTWWGVSFAPRLPFFSMSVAALLTIPVGIYLVNKYRKMPILITVPLSLLTTYFLLTGRMAAVTVLEGTFAFFLLVMASEPKTSPSVGVSKWIYGVMLGTLLGYLFVHRIAGEPYLAALLMMNLVFTGYKWVQLKLALRK